MMPYQVYQLYQAERTKTAAEIRRADEQLGELSRAFSSAWQLVTRPQAVLRALAGAVGGFRTEHEPVRPQQPAQPHGLRHADYLTGYHPSLPSDAPSAPSERPGEWAA